ITITATATTAASVSQTIAVNFASSSTNYFKSNGSGLWTAQGTWQSSYDNVNFYNATLAPTNSATGITIQSADLVYATAQPTSNNLTVNGTYEHRFDGGSLPTATWNSGSTCLITGTTATAPTNMVQAFYNLTWNSPMTGALTWGNSIPTNISGDLTFISTGSGSLRMSNNGATLTVAGNLNIQGGTFDFDNGGSAASTLNVNGNINLTGGNFQPNGAPASTHAHVINVKGNWANNGGTYTAGSESVIFIGSSAQTINGTTSTTFNELTISNTNASGVTIAANTKAALVTLNNTSASTEVLNVNAGNTLAVNGNIVLNSTDANLTNSITGSGSITAASLNIGITETPSISFTRTHTLNFNGPSLTLTGSININSYRGSSSSRLDNGILNFQSGTISAVNLVTSNSSLGNNVSTFDMTTGTGNGTLNVSGAFNLSATATNTIKLNGSGATVNYTGSSPQSIYSGSAYTNLGISGGSIKTLSGAITATSLNFSSDNATSGKIDASAFILTLTSASILNASSSGYVITGNGSGAGKLTVNGIGTNSFLFPIGTLADYLPATISPAASVTSWSANVFTPATTDATYNSGNIFTGTALADIVNSVWVITPSTTSTTATLTLNWTSDLEGSAFNGYSNSNIGISHYNTTSNVWQNSTATGGANNATNTVTSQFSSFSPFGVGAIGNPLPITIINFKAVLISNNTVSLTWQTTVEENSDHFDVQRSSDGSNWSSIGTLAAQGNSEIVTNYSYLDPSPGGGVNYYRLNMIDKNGEHSYTDVKVVNMNALAAFRIFPNPAKDFVNVTLGDASGNSTIRLFNFSGQIVFTQLFNKESGNTISIPVQNLSQGTYMLQVAGSDGSQHTGKVIIVR
ncbi:MAG TPA: T9SS type A sorting domain-containing protein, partial [Puia sp.]|nr:T9SS type A sorting domain-containing protein [Puia sp.]